MTETEIYSHSQLFQYLSAISATLGAFGLGTVFGWTSPGNTDLIKDPNFSYLETEDFKMSLFSALLPVGAIIACLVTGFMIGHFGRKTTMLLTAPPFVAGWLLMGFAVNFAMLFVGRLIVGFSGGAFSLAAPVYIGETAEPKLRGMLGSLYQLLTCIGILFVYAVGAFVRWDVLCFICAVIPAIFFICMFFMPESPRYYVIRGRDSDAAASLMKLRGANSQAQIVPELAALKESVEDAQKNAAGFKDLTEASILKPTCLSLALMLFQQLSGVNAVIFYAGQIFMSAGSTLEPNVQAIVVGAVQAIATFASVILVDRTGRKLLLIVSEVGMFIGLIALGAYFFLIEADENDPTAKSISWLPLVAVVVFITAYSLGLGPIPWLMVGEILPPRALGVASSISTVFNWLLAFIVTLTYDPLSQAIGNSWCFWGFAILCAIGAAFSIFILPETKGKSLDEIQALFGTKLPSNVSYDSTSDKTGTTYNNFYQNLEKS